MDKEAPGFRGVPRDVAGRICRALRGGLVRLFGSAEHRAGGEALLCLMWSGLRAQEAMAHAMALQDPPLLRTLSGPGPDTSASVESGAGSVGGAGGVGGGETPRELTPVCMVAATGATLLVLVELLAKVNAGLPAGARLELLLQNAVDAFVDGGTPLGLWALRRNPAAAAAGCRL